MIYEFLTLTMLYPMLYPIWINASLSGTCH
jgi:hypothetical protein